MMTKKMVDQAASGKTSFQNLMMVAAAASSVAIVTACSSFCLVQHVKSETGQCRVLTHCKN